MMIKLLKLKQKLYLLLLLCCITGTLVAQDSSEKQKLEGKWLLEAASAIVVDGGDSISIDTKSIKNNPNIIVPDSFEFSKKSLRTVRDEIDFYINAKIKIVNQNTNSISSPLNLNYEVKDGILYIKYYYNPEVSRNSIYYISLTYKPITE